MIIDADQDFAAVRSVLGGRFDVCIAGAGVAGITLAHVLSTRGLNVVLLEGGGEDYEDQSQDLYTGQNVGRAYFDLDISRLRYFGGTSNHWNGVCRPLDASDFQQRAYADLSGWPISRDDLDPYQPATTDILGLEPFRDDVEVPGSNGNLRSIKFEERDNDPVRFAGKFGDEIRASEAITALLNTNLVDIDVDDGNGRITGFQVRGYAEGGETLTVKADRYVLALGAIENARMRSPFVLGVNATADANRLAPFRSSMELYVSASGAGGHTLLDDITFTTFQAVDGNSGRVNAATSASAMDFIARLCDPVIVMAEGRVLMSGSKFPGHSKYRRPLSLLPPPRRTGAPDLMHLSPWAASFVVRPRTMTTSAARAPVG